MRAKPPVASLKHTDTPAFRRWFQGSKVVDANGKPLVMLHGTPTHGREANNRYVRSEQADVEYREFEVFRTRGDGFTDSGWLGEGVYFTPSPSYAFEFGNFLMPAFLKIERPFEIHDDHTAGSANQLRFLKSLQPLQGLPERFRLDLSMPVTHHAKDSRGRPYSRYFRLSELTSEEDGKKYWALVMCFEEGSAHGIVESKGATPDEAIFNFRYPYAFPGFLLHTLGNLGAQQFRALLEKNGYDGVIAYREAYCDEAPGRYIREAVVFEPVQIKSSVGNRGAFDPSDPSIRG